MTHDPGIIEFWCYVCGLRINENPVSVGNEVFRHRRCKPGTKKWMESEVGKKSPYRSFFEKKKLGECKP